MLAVSTLRDVCFSKYLLVSSRTDVYPQRFTTGLELVGDRHVVAEQAVSRHFHAYHAGQYRSGVQSDSHLNRDDNEYYNNMRREI